jgi:ABC-type branched-subunit amino acid transport system substrate-binding protein
MVVTAADQESGFVPPKPPPRWWLRIGLAVVVAAALVAGGLWAWDHFLVRCGDGVRKQGAYDECIGVTDGAYVFDAELNDITTKIHKANQKAEKGDWVAIAYIEPMTQGTGGKGWGSIEEELQGAYLAQKELNQESGGHGTRPQIKLLLANPGRGLEQQAELVDQIIGMTHGPHPVVAVAGFGLSRLGTKDAVRTLRENGVPMVGSTVTADRLSSNESGFFRAVAPNSAEAAAVARHLVKQQKKSDGFRVQLIKDRNTDDIYSDSLAEGFTDAAERAGLELDPETVPFISGPDRAVNLAMDTVADKICDQQEPPGAVYFAGRGRDLRRFIESAHANGRHCPVTVYTGDDAVGMFFGIDPDVHPDEYDDFLKDWKHSKVRVKYTAIAHPDAAGDIYPDGAGPYSEFADTYMDTPGFKGKSGLLNGQAMLGHDAVLAVGTAIRDAKGKRGTGTVTKRSVLGMLLQISGDKALHGVSGPIGFDDMGNPAHKPLPLVELHPRDRNQYEYLTLVRP